MVYVGRTDGFCNIPVKEKTKYQRSLIIKFFGKKNVGEQFMLGKLTLQRPQQCYFYTQSLHYLAVSLDLIKI